MTDTIAAISTAIGKGAISIIRLSGKDAIKIAASIFKGPNLTKVASHTITYGYIIDKDELIDEVLISIMKAPRTYTTEDIVEINCHGSIATTNKILELVLTKGARLADKGEFTKRAFLNGRIDLSQSEAVIDLLESKTNTSRQLALSSLTGTTKNLIKEFRQEINDIIANISVNIDYPEYHDIEEMTITKLKEKVQYLTTKLEEIIKSSKSISLIKEGIKTVIVGRPNVGKSSILNHLLDYDKAIVTDIAGTTRDIVEGEIYLESIPLNIIDTAGIRPTNDEVEKIGVQKSLELLTTADLVLMVLNNNEPLTEEDKELMKLLDDKNTILVLNKSDLPIILNKKDLPFTNIVETSTTTKDGLKSLKEKIIQLYNLEEITSLDYNYLTTARQVSLALSAKEILSNILKEVEETPIDMIELDLRQAFYKLGEILGETYDDEILDNLFDKFCVGK